MAYNPYDQQILGMEQQRRTAEALRQRGMEAPQGQMVGRTFIAPNITQYLAKGLQAYMGGKQAREAQEQIAALEPERRAYAEEMARRNEQLVTTMGPEGKPVYTRRSEAEGMQPYQTPGSATAYYRSIPTSQGLMTFDARTGRYERAALPPAEASATEAEPIMRPQDDPALQARIESAKKGAGEAQKLSTEAYKSLQSVNTNMANLDEVVRLIDKGAESGVIQSKLPSVRAVSVELDNMRNQLGLDVVGATTFGALSEGELSMALDTALPTNLPPAELRQWAINKKAAQQKLADYLGEQVRFLRGGKTVADWLDHQESKKQSAATQDVEKPSLAAPRAGTEQDGYRFKGGDPADPNSWEKI